VQPGKFIQDITLKQDQGYAKYNGNIRHVKHARLKEHEIDVKKIRDRSKKQPVEKVAYPTPNQKAGSDDNQIRGTGLCNEQIKCIADDEYRKYGQKYKFDVNRQRSANAQKCAGVLYFDDRHIVFKNTDPVTVTNRSSYNELRCLVAAHITEHQK
jgi:hypothetical protein